MEDMDLIEETEAQARLKIQFKDGGGGTINIGLGETHKIRGDVESITVAGVASEVRLDIKEEK